MGAVLVEKGASRGILGCFPAWSCERVRAACLQVSAPFKTHRLGPAHALILLPSVTPTHPAGCGEARQCKSLCGRRVP